MTYTDGVHLVADSLDELHAFADRLYMRRSWFQRGRHPHYDLTTPRSLSRALRAGAVKTDRRAVCLKARALAVELATYRPAVAPAAAGLIMSAAAIANWGTQR